MKIGNLGFRKADPEPDEVEKTIAAESDEGMETQQNTDRAGNISVKVEMVDIRQAEAENSFNMVETPKRRILEDELLGGSRKNIRAPLGDNMITMNTQSSHQRTMRKPRYDERVASTNGSLERAERFKKNEKNQDEFMRVLKYSADKTAKKLKDISLRKMNSQEKSNGRRRSLSDGLKQRKTIPKQMYLTNNL